MSVYRSSAGVHWLFYRGADGALWSRSGTPGQAWSKQKIITPEPMPTMAPGTTPSGYIDQQSGTQWVYFVGADRNLWQVYYVSGQWHAYQLSSGTGNRADIGSSPVAVRDGNFHWVYYVGEDRRIKQYWFDGASWGLSNLGSTNSVYPSSDITVQYNPSGLVRTVYYRDSNKRIRYWRNLSYTTWTDNAPGSGQPAEIAASTPSFVPAPSYAGGLHHVFYKGQSDGATRYWAVPATGAATNNTLSSPAAVQSGTAVAPNRHDTSGGVGDNRYFTQNGNYVFGYYQSALTGGIREIKRGGGTGDPAALPWVDSALPTSQGAHSNTPAVIGNSTKTYVYSVTSDGSISQWSRNVGSSWVHNKLSAAGDGPANDTLPAISGQAKLEQTLTASTGTWIGASAATYTYQWSRCDATGDICSQIVGATNSTYTATQGDLGSRLRVVVTASTAVLSAAATSAPTSVVTAVGPSNTTPPSVAGTAVVSGTLTADNGTWSGTGPISYAYSWLKCNGAGADCAPIPGAQTPQLSLQANMYGSTIKVKVTATNTVGSETATSSATDAVASAPFNTTPPHVSVDSDSDSTAHLGVWEGNAPITYTYQWLRCAADGNSCSDLSGATEPTRDFAVSDLGATLRVRVTAENSYGTASQTTAPTDVIHQDGLGLASRYEFETFPFSGGTVNVNRANGNVVVTSDGGVVSAPDDSLSLSRNWNSREAGFARPTYGNGWTPDVGPEVRLEHDVADDSYQLFGPTGESVAFTKDENDDWQSTPGSGAVLITSPETDEVFVDYPDDGERLVFAGEESDLNLSLSTVQHDDGQDYALAYDGGRLDTITGSDEGAAAFEYDANDHLDEVTVGTDVWDYSVNAEGDLTEVVTPDESSVSYDYDGEGRITEITDADGNLTTLDWDSQNRLTEITTMSGDPEEKSTQVAYGSPISQCTSYLGTNTFTYQDATYSKYCYDASLKIRRTISNSNGDEVEEPAAIEFLEDEYSMSEGQAEAWLSSQGAADSIEADILDSAAASDFAGIWFDNANRRIKLALTSNAHMSTVEDIIDGVSQTEETDISIVSHSAAELEIAQEALDSELDTLANDGVVRITAELNNQQLLVEVADDASPTDYDTIEDAASLSTVPTSITEVDPDEFLGDLDANDCGLFGCNKPLRGGHDIKTKRRKIGSGQPTGCTGGFISIRRSDDKPLQMSAGHCFMNFANDFTTPWFAATAMSSKLQQIGLVSSRHLGSSGDAGAIEITGSYWRSADLMPWIQIEDFVEPQLKTDYRYVIQSVATNRNYKMGRIVCTAAATGTTCGRIVNRSASVLVPNPTGGARIRVKDYVVIKDCGGESGDSGAPVVFRHIAMGLMSGRGPNCTRFLTKAENAENLTNSDILLPMQT